MSAAGDDAAHDGHGEEVTVADGRGRDERPPQGVAESS